MKKKYVWAVGIIAILVTVSLLWKPSPQKVEVPTEVALLRAKHAEFLKNSPFKETQHLSKKDRKNRGLPPNPYYERLWEMSMNPALGRPTWENINRLQEERYANRNDPRAVRPQRAPGDLTDNPWVERGPNNIGGRTRVVVFDPNDTIPPINSRVFAGGVSGGLWKNEDITNASSPWNQVTTVPGHLNVSSFAIDPNNPQIMYLGTGEQYTFGAAVGNGVYKSTNGGENWNKVNIPLSPNDPGNNIPASADVLSGIFYINDIIVRNNGGNSEVYVAVGSHVFGASRIADAGNPDQFTGSQSAGLYRSADGGATWTRNESANLSFSVFSGAFTFYFTPNDFEIGPDNKLWMGMISTPGFGITGGGKIFNSTDGLNWTEVTTLTNSNRVEIEVSASDPNRVYALTQGTTAAAPVRIFSSTNGSTFTAAATLPDDADNGIPANDFTRGQAFYDLVIEADPTNHNLVYVGGIDLFRGVFNGTNNFNWTQISKWSNNPNLGTLSVPVVHADQHGFTFRPGNPNQAVLGHDGGVSFANSLSTADSNPNAIATHNVGYAVTQFYYGDIARLTNPSADDIVGGTQDNGTQFSRASGAGINPFVIEFGGDGAFTEIDKDGDYMISSFPGNSHVFLAWPVTNNSPGYTIVDEGNNGSFINTAALDENLDILYTDASNSTTNRLGRYSNLKTGAVNIEAATFTGSDRDGITIDASITALKVSPFTTSSTTLFIGLLNSRLLKVTQAQRSITSALGWSEITGPGFVGSISDIEFGQSENEILVTMHNFGVPSLWYTNDGGTTWQNKEGNLPDIPVRAVLQVPFENTDPVTGNLIGFQEVIVGTMLGVWRTQNFLDTIPPVWEQSQNGMSDVSVVDLDLILDPEIVSNPPTPPTATVLATTHGRGMFTGTFSEPTLSLDDKNFVRSQLKIFPTLASTEINLIANNNLGEAQVKIYNLSGQEMLSQKMDLNFGNNNRLLLNGFSNGVYILSVKGEGISKTQKFVVRK
ncbi:MAG: T9SS type A sorting domain-containing protein [Flavobacteriaceae bacterium]|nr:T9SS type A sorting domain-containing protein [Flavobacteriaceae bacterium]